MNNSPLYYSQQARPLPARRRKGCRPGCIVSALTFLILLLIVAMGGWLLFVRPYAQSLIDKALTGAVDQVQLPAVVALLPAGQQVPVTEDGINNTLVLHLAPSDPVQKPNTAITPQNVRVTFQIYGFDCAISLVPAVDNARLIVTNVNIEGIAGLLISPDELTTLLNKHLADAQQKLQRSITAVKLVDHEILLTLG